MIKICQPHSYCFDATIASLVDLHSRGLDRAWCEKRGAAEAFKFAADLAPEPGTALIHLLAMGDAEVYGGNRNGDLYFGSGRTLDLPEPHWDRVLLKKANKDGSPRYHVRGPETFTDKILFGNDKQASTFELFGHVFKDHKNKPYPHPDPEWDTEQNGPGPLLAPDKIYGAIKRAVHNAKMHRVELMVQVPLGKDWDDDLEKIARGVDIPWSMACKVPWDVCMFCGHKAPTVDDYCPHVGHHMTELTKDGHFIGVANEKMAYFDISRVRRPADRIAWSFYGIFGDKSARSRDIREKQAAWLAGQTKLAGELQAEYDAYAELPVSPVQTAARLELLRKAAAIEKRVPLTADRRLLRGIKPATEPTIKLSSLHQIPAVLRTLADEKIILSLPAWAALAYGEKTAGVSGAIAEAARGGAVFGRVLEQEPEQVAGNETWEPQASLPERSWRIQAEKWAGEAGLSRAAVCRRAMLSDLNNLPTPSVVYCPAGLSKEAMQLTREYAAYQLAALDHVRRSDPANLEFTLQATVLRNCVQ